VPSVQGGAAADPGVEIGDVVGELRSEWGRSVDLIALEPATILTLDAAAVEATIEVAERRSVLGGMSIGRLELRTPSGTQSVRVETAGAIGEPGIAWRFADPLTVLDRWLD